MNTRSKGWHPEDIKAAIRKKGTTLSELSRDHGLSDSALRNALIRPLYRAEIIIARFLNVPAHDLWPDRYDAAGERTIATRRRNLSRPHRRRQRQKARAA